MPSRSSLSSRPCFAAVLPWSPDLVRARRIRDVYASSSSRADSSSGVYVGNNCRVGSIASSRTLPMPRSARIRVGQIRMNTSAARRPWSFDATVMSSRRAKRKGVNEGQCCSRRLDYGRCQYFSGAFVTDASRRTHPAPTETGGSWPPLPQPKEQPSRRRSVSVVHRASRMLQLGRRQSDEWISMLKAAV